MAHLAAVILQIVFLPLMPSTRTLTQVSHPKRVKKYKVLKKALYIHLGNRKQHRIDVLGGLTLVLTDQPCSIT
jgi:hypothetical protein